MLSGTSCICTGAGPPSEMPSGTRIETRSGRSEDDASGTTVYGERRQGRTVDGQAFTEDSNATHLRLRELETLRSARGET